MISRRRFIQAASGLLLPTTGIVTANAQILSGIMMGGVDPAAAAIIAQMRTTSEPSAARIVAINDLVKGWRACGFWGACGAIYMCAGASQTEPHSLIDWKVPTSSATKVGTPDLTDSGWRSNVAAANYIRHHKTWSHASTLYTQTAAHSSCWTISDVNAGTTPIGTQTTNNNSYMIRSGTQTNPTINGFGVNLTDVTSRGVGWQLWERTSSTGVAYRYNGNSYSTTGTTTAANPVEAANPVLFMTNGGALYTGRIACWTIGVNVGSTIAAAAYSYLRAYMTAAGVA